MSLFPDISDVVTYDPSTAAPKLDSIKQVEHATTACFACPRLVAWREQVARDKRASYMGEEYWGRPVPAFGDYDARILVVGLAPAAHGANRTGRMFTGDRSGDWLFRAMYNAGLANQPQSLAPDDGLQVRSALITATNRCAPPDNKPTTVEQATCLPWMVREVQILSDNLRVIVTLGGIAHMAALRALVHAGITIPKPRPKFGHGTETQLDGGITMLGSYHPSQQNTFTGRLTEPMLDAVFMRAVELAELPTPPDGFRR